MDQDPTQSKKSWKQDWPREFSRFCARSAKSHLVLLPALERVPEEVVTDFEISSLSVQKISKSWFTCFLTKNGCIGCQNKVMLSEWPFTNCVWTKCRLIPVFSVGSLFLIRSSFGSHVSKVTATLNPVYSRRREPEETHKHEWQCENVAVWCGVHRNGVAGLFGHSNLPVSTPGKSCPLDEMFVNSWTGIYSSKSWPATPTHLAQLEFWYGYL